MEELAKARVKDYDENALYYDGNDIRGEVSIATDEEDDFEDPEGKASYEFQPLRDDYPATRVECSCKGKEECSTCGGKGFYFELKARNLFVVDEGWV